jgi:hypothetical protein
MRRYAAAASARTAALLAVGCGGEQTEQPQTESDRAVLAKAATAPAPRQTRIVSVKREARERIA